tara:strand:- start:246 stop:704 length:459 start_codon:yes stop_codon:yes gene_type:complete
MSATTTLHRATVKDKHSLLAIETCCFSTDRISPRQMHYLLTHAKATTLMALFGSQIVGYGMCLLPRPPRPARLYSLAVLPDWRGQQLARRLCESLLLELRSLHYSRCRLEVRRSQTAVQNLYLSLGFRPIDELPSYYLDQEDGLRMECTLNA